MRVAIAIANQRAVRKSGERVHKFRWAVTGRSSQQSGFKLPESVPPKLSHRAQPEYSLMPLSQFGWTAAVSSG